MNRSPSLAMSQILDAPLLSPLAEVAPWDESLYSTTTSDYSHYFIPASPSSSTSDSPISTSKMLKMRMSPDSAAKAEQQQLCLPTHQVFDFPERPSPAAAGSPQPQERLSISINPAAIAASVAAMKRSASPAPSLSKKPRSSGERISSKDFVPPDVSGLSKREARLVKNRAAAFLSRQRKREEFECMEIRVAELEQENARLLALTQNGASAPNASSTSELVSEIESLKAQLEAAKERERQLAAQLLCKAETVAPPSTPAIKVEETADPQLPLSPPTRSAPSPHKSGASLGLMVLLCALPTLLSMPMHSALPKSFALPDAPLPAAPATFDFNSIMPGDYDWSRTLGNSMMDLNDIDMSPSFSPAPTSRKLEFATSGASSEVDSGLGGLDISFDTLPADNGKIRVRIHPSSSASSRAASPGPSTVSDSKSDIASWSPESEPSLEASFSSQSFSSSLSLSSSPSLSSLSSSSSSYLSPPSPGGDPFLGVGASSDYSMPYANEVSDMFGQLDDSLSGIGDYGSEYSSGDSTAKRRVRIALKSLPAAGGEGGEWEVQIC
ncbi:hypothetical protein H0H81_008000 [Sphagnurus paluster]|uniref:BZIP domain-containing protein n=1 Tax=Sphagnurus paluster TaxID=117069 RepID=A0A9P7GK94_9AGAR|nr:hypothetical protein H0H81_008000 [Sphagnurus paluster]